MIDETKYRLIWDYSNGNPTWSMPKSMSSLRKYYKENGYTVKIEGKKLYIMRRV